MAVQRELSGRFEGEIAFSESSYVCQPSCVPPSSFQSALAFRPISDFAASAGAFGAAPSRPPQPAEHRPSWGFPTERAAGRYGENLLPGAGGSIHPTSGDVFHSTIFGSPGRPHAGRDSPLTTPPEPGKTPAACHEGPSPPPPTCPAPLCCRSAEGGRQRGPDVGDGHDPGLRSGRHHEGSGGFSLADLLLVRNRLPRQPRGKDPAEDHNGTLCLARPKSSSLLPILTNNAEKKPNAILDVS